MRAIWPHMQGEEVVLNDKDLIEELRSGIDPNDIPAAECLMRRAADEIERLWKLWGNRK